MSRGEADLGLFQRPPTGPLIQWRISMEKVENPSLLSPWLVFFENESVCAFIDPKHGNKYIINLPQVLKGENMDRTLDFSCIGFSSSPPSSECVVVNLSKYESDAKFVVEYSSSLGQDLDLDH